MQKKPLIALTIIGVVIVAYVFIYSAYLKGYENGTDEFLAIQMDEVPAPVVAWDIQVAIEDLENALKNNESPKYFHGDLLEETIKNQKQLDIQSKMKDTY